MNAKLSTNQPKSLAEIEKQIRKIIGDYFDDCPHINSKLKDEGAVKITEVITTLIASARIEELEWFNQLSLEAGVGSVKWRLAIKNRIKDLEGR